MGAFGEFMRARRAERRMSLRAFCAAARVDPANYSKVERGVLPPPRDHETLERYARALEIEADSAEVREMERLASLDRGELPERILSDRELVGKLPALFRTLEGDPVDESLLDELIQTIRGEYGHVIPND